MLRIRPVQGEGSTAYRYEGSQYNSVLSWMCVGEFYKSQARSARTANKPLKYHFRVFNLPTASKELIDHG
jgi:hypothetical protein